MKYCKNCNVEVSAYHKRCPLCQGNLSDDGEEAKKEFPHFPSYTSFKEGSTNSLVLSTKLLLLAVGIFSVILNVVKPSMGYWSLLILITEAAFWWWFSIAIKFKRNIIKKFAQMVYIWGGFSIVFDILTGWKKWSFHYVVPILIISSIVIISLIEKGMKNQKQERVFHNFLLSVTGIIFLLIMLIVLGSYNIPAYILLGVCVLELCRSIVFDRDELLNDLQKRFHI